MIFIFRFSSDGDVRSSSEFVHAVSRSSSLGGAPLSAVFSS